MGSDPENFANDVVMALDGKAIDNDLPRLQAEIVTTSGNRIKCDPALNDLLISNTHHMPPSYYRLQRDADGMNPDIDVIQHSSGCLFSTFVGQGAWFRNICDIEGRSNSQSSKSTPTTCLSVVNWILRHDDPANTWLGRASRRSSPVTCIVGMWSVTADETCISFGGASITVSMEGPRLHLLTFREPIVEKLAHWLD